MTTFAAMAPALWAMGWRGLVPLRPRSKIPAIKGWERFNQGQTELELAQVLRTSASRTPGSGVGACAGNGVLFLDLDIAEPSAQVRAQAIVEDLLDVTPLIRVGRPPKAVMMYRSDASGLRRNPAGLAIEVFGGGRPTSGQVVVAGIHPATGSPYTYARHRPSETPLAELPDVHEELLEDLVEILARDPVIRTHGMVSARAGERGTNDGSGLLRLASRVRAERGGLQEWLQSRQAGGRHNAALAAVMAAVRAGLDPEEEAAEIEAIEIAFREAKPEAPPSEWRDIVRWGRRHTRPRSRTELLRRLGLEEAHG